MFLSPRHTPWKAVHAQCLYRISAWRQAQPVAFRNLSPWCMGLTALLFLAFIGARDVCHCVLALFMPFARCAHIAPLFHRGTCQVLLASSGPGAAPCCWRWLMPSCRG